MRYTVVFEQSPHNWSAYVPDVPGCVAAAKTRTGTERLIREALELHIEAMVEDGEGVPQPGTWTSIVEVKVPGADAEAPETGEPQAKRPARKRASA